MILVVEGAARAVAAEPVPDAHALTRAPGPTAQIEVTAAAGSGDDTIVGVAGAALGTARVLVVTADRELAARVTSAGAATAGPSWLLRLIEAVEAG
jgi:8-oxo-dGTP diphosphatase